MRLINGSRCFTFVSSFSPFFSLSSIYRGNEGGEEKENFVQGIREVTVLERNEYLILMTLTRKNEGGKGKEEWKVNGRTTKSNEMVAPMI